MEKSRFRSKSSTNQIGYFGTVFIGQNVLVNHLKFPKTNMFVCLLAYFVYTLAYRANGSKFLYTFYLDTTDNAPRVLKNSPYYLPIVSENMLKRFR